MFVCLEETFTAKSRRHVRADPVTHVRPLPPASLILPLPPLSLPLPSSPLLRPWITLSPTPRDMADLFASRGTPPPSPPLESLLCLTSVLSKLPCTFGVDSRRYEALALHRFDARSSGPYWIPRRARIGTGAWSAARGPGARGGRFRLCAFDRWRRRPGTAA